MKKTKCEKCGHEFANRGGCFNRHYKACNGSYIPNKALEYCPHCQISFTGFIRSQIANHVRWCVKNPKHLEYKEKTKQLSINNTGRKLSAETKEKIKQAHQDGKYAHLDYSKINISRPHTEETKEKLREKALQSPHRRLKKSTVEYKGVLLDSTWELELAKRLDRIDIKWIRPDPIVWIDGQGKSHHYFPDFYLPEYDLFLDPKNPQAVRVQQKKLDILLKQYPNIKILYSLNECKEFSL